MSSLVCGQEFCSAASHIMDSNQCSGQWLFAIVDPLDFDRFMSFSIAFPRYVCKFVKLTIEKQYDCNSFVM
jgi:hypothetical protein